MMKHTCKLGGLWPGDCCHGHCCMVTVAMDTVDTICWLLRLKYIEEEMSKRKGEAEGGEEDVST